ncbi:potassium channel family protein [Sulfurospirillum sp. 1307]
MMKVVLFGYSKTGREIAKILKDDEYDFSIIEEDPLKVSEAKIDGYDCWHTNLKDDSVLEEIGIGKDVDVLFCASNDDSLNLFVTLSARNLDENLKILTLIYKKDDEKKMLLAGANRTISPYDVGAIKAYRIIDKPKVSKVLNLFSSHSNKLSISEIEVPKNSILDGVYFKDVDIFKKHNLIFLGILDRELDDKFIFFSQGINHKIDAKDVLVVLGSKSDIKKFKKEISA